jgi:hypothetical protein
VSPTVAVSPCPGALGTEFVVTLTHAPAAGWLTIAPVVSSNSTYGPWVYVAALPSAGGMRIWRVTPAAGGSYEARYYSDGGFTRGATSAPFTVIDAGSASR